MVGEPEPGHERLRDFLAIPYLAHDGHPVAIRFRCIQPECEHKGHGKYMSLEDSGGRLYNVGAIHRADDTIAVTEGEPDCWTLEQLGIPAIGVPGANMWKPHHRRMLAGFSRVWVFGDGDEAGGKFANTVCRSLGQATAVRMPKGHDVNSLYVEHGEDAVRDLMEEEEND